MNRPAAQPLHRCPDFHSNLDLQSSCPTSLAVNVERLYLLGYRCYDRSRKGVRSAPGCSRHCILVTICTGGVRHAMQCDPRRCEVDDLTARRELTTRALDEANRQRQRMCERAVSASHGWCRRRRRVQYLCHGSIAAQECDWLHVMQRQPVQS